MGADQHVSAPASRKLGPWMCLALVMGNMIGSGVFLLPTSLAPYGWNAVPAWILTIGGVLAIAAVLGRLTRALPAADGPHGFTLAAFGEMPAFLVSWGYWISTWVGNAAIALAATSYLSVFAPGIAAVPGLPAVITIGFVWMVAFLNMRGARVAGGFSILTMAVKMIPIIAVMGIVLVVTARSGGAELAPLPAAGFSASAITSAAALTLWAALGFEAISVAKDRVADPGIAVPRALMLGVALVGIVYIVACSGIALLLPPEVATTSDAPFSDFVARYWGRGPSLFIALFAAVSALGALNGLTLAAGAQMLTLARSGRFPGWFAATAADGTPVRCIAGSSVLTTILLVLNSSSSMASMFTFLALMSTAATLFLYLAVSLAATRLRIGGTVALIASAYSLWTFWGAGFEATGWSIVLLLGGLPLFYLRGRNAVVSA